MFSKFKKIIKKIYATIISLRFEKSGEAPDPDNITLITTINNAVFFN